MEGLVAQGLQKWFKHRKVVDNVSVDIQRGEVVGLLGPNGAGKTTSFYMIVGVLPTEGGRIFLEGREITALPMYQRGRMGVGYLTQESSVFRKLTVEENLLAILETLDLGAAERKERARELLDELDLTSLAPYPAYTLSGGERRRLEITRALVTAPQFLLLDEPFTGIDPIAIADIQEIISRLRDRGIGDPDHRPQRARDAGHHGPCLHPLRRQDSGVGHGQRDRQQSDRPRDLSRREVRPLGRRDDVAMAMEARLSLRQSQRVVMTPLLQQAIQLLQLSTLELQEVVQKELLENPLLEEVPRDRAAPRLRLDDARRARHHIAGPAPVEPPPTNERQNRHLPFDLNAVMFERSRGALAGLPGGT